MDGKAGAPIVSDGIKDQPGEGVVALEHVSETDKSYKTEISLDNDKGKNRVGDKIYLAVPYLSTSVVKLLSRECLLCPGPGPRPSSPPWARLAMLMCRADLRNTGHTDSKWGAAAQNHLKQNLHETFAN